MLISLPKRDALYAADLRWLSTRKTSTWGGLSYADRVSTRDQFAKHFAEVAKKADQNGGECPYELDEGLIKFSRRYMWRRLIWVVVLVCFSGIPALAGCFAAVLYVQMTGRATAAGTALWFKYHTHEVLPIWIPTSVLFAVAVISIYAFFGRPRKTLRILRHYRRAKKDPLYRMPHSRRF